MKHLTALVALALSASAAMAGDLTITQAYVPAAPKGMMVHAAYMTLENKSDKTRSLIGVKAKGYGMAHLHQSIHKDGVATMSMVHQLDIEPGMSVSLKPGSFHIMLMHPKATLALGSAVSIELQFANGETQDVLATIKERSNGS